MKARLFAVLITLSILAAGILGLWFGGRYIVSVLGAMDWSLPRNLALLLGASFLLAALVIGSALRASKRRDAELQVREMRRGAYEACLASWQGALRAAQERGGPIAGHLPKDALTVHSVILARASARVLTEYRDLVELGLDPDVSHDEVLDQLLNFLGEIRFELGVGRRYADEPDSLREMLLSPIGSVRRHAEAGRGVPPAGAKPSVKYPPFPLTP